MAGPAPLTYITIEAWARLNDIGELHPVEVQALLLLDAAMFVTEHETDKEEQPTLQVGTRKWPSPKTPPQET